MILLDTHIWVWWIEGNDALDRQLREAIDRHGELSISAISPWEVAMKVRRGGIRLSLPLEQWIDIAVNTAGVAVLPITPQVAIESTILPGDFHNDPADRFIVATARVYNIPLATQDNKILQYPRVQCVHHDT